MLLWLPEISPEITIGRGHSHSPEVDSDTDTCIFNCEVGVGGCGSGRLRLRGECGGRRRKRLELRDSGGYREVGLIWIHFMLHVDSLLDAVPLSRTFAWRRRTFAIELASGCWEQRLYSRLDIHHPE